MHDGQMLYDAEQTWNKQAWEVDVVMANLLAENKNHKIFLFRASLKKNLFNETCL